MKNFQQLVQSVLDEGQLYSNGKGHCLGVIGAQVKYDVSEHLPAVTAKKTNIIWAVAEMCMFLKGISHIDFLKPYGAEKIWEAQGLQEDQLIDTVRPPMDVTDEYAQKTNTSPEDAQKFLMARAEEYQHKRMALTAKIPPEGWYKDQELAEGYVTEEEYNRLNTELEEELAKPFTDLNISLRAQRVVRTKGDLGPIYGSQWRSWIGVAPNGKVVKIDQLKDVVRKLKEVSTSRQVILTAWNPMSISSELYSYDQKIHAGLMGQPPCHVNYHFLIRTDKNGVKQLNTTVWLRSNDLMLGHAFNAIGGAVITHLIANSLDDVKPGQLCMQISDAHIYEEHIEGAKEYVSRETFDLPTFSLPKEINIDNFTVEDILAAIGEYKHGPYMPFPLKTRVDEEAAK